MNNNVDCYCSWIPFGNQSIRDTEIGINSFVAEAIGNLILKIYQKRRKLHALMILTASLNRFLNKSGYLLNEIFHQKYYDYDVV